MGTDIHAFIDYDDGRRYDRTVFVNSFGNGIRIQRNYWLFSLMANIRCDSKELCTKKLLISPRGVPENLSSETLQNYYLRADDELAKNDNEGRYCTIAEAEKYGWYDKKKRLAYNPDWHTPTYFYVKELKIIQKRYSKLKDPDTVQYLKEGKEIPEEYKILKTINGYHTIDLIEPKELGKHELLEVIIATMKALNGKNPKRSRLVVWFDN